MKKSYIKIISLVLVALMLLSVVGTVAAEPLDKAKETREKIKENNGVGILDRIRQRMNFVNRTENETGISGQEIRKAKLMDKEKVKEIAKNKKIVGPVYSAQGFALNDDEYHVVNIHVVGLRRLDPNAARDLLKENENITNISEEFQSRTKAYHIGKMKFGEEFYMLRVVKVDGDQLIANILTIPSKTVDDSSTEESTKEVVGNVSLRILEHEGAVICDGTIDIEGTEYRTLMNVLKSNNIWRKNIGNLEVVVEEETEVET